MGLTDFSRATRQGAACLLLAAATTGCAMPALTKSAAAPVSPAVSVVAKRPIQSIRQEPAGVDGQTSWILEPEVPRIPEVAGLDPQLPPHIERRLSYAFDLVQRGATYSANSEFQSVLGLCALELDARDGGTSHREALRQAMVALDEADELAGYHAEWRQTGDIRLITANHLTPVLKGEGRSGVDAIHAIQLYYAYAEERFTFACGELPGASMACYGLARTYVLPGTQYTHATGKAAMLQRVALRIAPQNALAGNELGVLLAQHGHLEEAEALFRRCVATDATPETWQNLAVVCARQGDEQASQAAMAAGAALAAKDGAAESATAVTGLAADAAPEQAIASRDRGEPAAKNPREASGQTAASEPRDGGEAKPSFWAKLDVMPGIPLFRR